MFTGLLAALIISFTPLDSAYLNAAGQLVTVQRVDNFGFVVETYTVVHRERAPVFCTTPDRRHMLYTQEYLIIQRTPVVKQRKLCPNWDFVKRKCRVKKKK